MSDDDTTTKTNALALTSSDLDEAVDDVRAICGDAMTCFWRLGRRLADIHDRQLWKLRVDDNGRRLHNSFAAFVHAEVPGVSVTRAHEFIEAARQLSEAQARRLGRTKCTLLLRAAPEDRAALAEEAETSTTRQLATAAKESREARGYTKPTQQAAAGRASRAKQTSTSSPTTTTSTHVDDARPVLGERVTVAVMHGVKRAKLYQRPASLKGINFDALPRARKISDVPFGELELANGVKLTVAVVRDARGDLVLKAEALRERFDDESEETST